MTTTKKPFTPNNNYSNSNNRPYTPNSSSPSTGSRPPYQQNNNQPRPPGTFQQNNNQQGTGFRPPYSPGGFQQPRPQGTFNSQQPYNRDRNFNKNQQNFSNDEHRINGRISAREVRVITEAGEQLGVLPLYEALNKAENMGLDLVEVAPNAQPPVCKIMDYGKFKYKEQKKEADAKKNRTENTLKELRIRYNTDIGDLTTKIKHAKEFLEDGDKVKFSMRFKGRERAHTDLGIEKFDKITAALIEFASIDEKSPSGANMYIVYAPLKDLKKKITPSKTSGGKNPKEATSDLAQKLSLALNKSEKGNKAEETPSDVIKSDSVVKDNTEENKVEISTEKNTEKKES